MGGYLQEGRRRLEQALAGAPEAGPERAEALWSCAWVAALQGDGAGADAHLAQSIAYAGAVHDDRTAAHCSTWSATIALFRGDLEAAEASFGVAAAGHRANGDLEGILMTLFQLAITTSLRGEHRRAERLCDEAVTLSEQYGETWARSYALWARAHAAWSRGEHADAARLAQESLRLKEPFDDRLGSALVVEVLAAATAALGRHAQAARLFGIADQWWRAIHTRLDAFGSQLAESRTRSTADVLKAMGEPAFKKAYRTGLALPRGDLWATVLDDGPTRASAADKATSVPSTQQEGLALLTRREHQVALLMAQGKANRDIAAELIISNRTVEGHVEHVLAKLGFRSRAEVAAWAATSGFH